jgi:diguanylate cyclase (GGDEF)-like protein/PAS domain S-box-containing protein
MLKLHERLKLHLRNGPLSLLDLGKVAALAAAYCLLGMLGHELAAVHNHVSLVWPAAGLAVAALVCGGVRLLPGVAIGSLAANVLAGMDWKPALLIAAGATLEAFAAAWLLSRHEGFNVRLNRLRDVIYLAFPAALGATLIGATVGSATLLIYGLVEPPQLAAVWLTWWGGDAQGVLLVTPLLFAWAVRRKPDLKLLEAFGVALVVAAALLFISLLESRLGTSATQFLISFTFFPLAVWPAVRFRMREVASFNFSVACLCIVGTALGWGPFVGNTDPLNLFGLHGLLSAVSLTTLLLCAISTERREGAARLRESEERFRDLTELSVDWYWEQDAELRFIELSPGFRATSPFDQAEYIGRRRWEMPFLYRDSAEWQEHQRRCEAHLPFRDFLLVRQGQGGELYYSLSSGEPKFDEAGNFKGYRGIGRDITAQKRAEIALAESHELFERIFDASPIPMMFRRLQDGIVAAVNPAWCKLYGYRRQDVEGRHVFELGLLANHTDRDRIREALARDGAVRDMEIRAQVRDGEQRDILYSAEGVDFRGDRCVVVSILDVTERRKAEEQVRDSNARLHRMFRASPHPVAISGMVDGRIMDVNDAWCDAYGYSREDVLGRDFLGMGVWATGSVRTDLRDHLMTHGSIREFECQWRRKSGDVAEVLLSGDVLEFAGERVLLSSVIDVTERVRGQARLRESESRFSTIFSASPVPIMISRIADGGYVEVNDAWTRFFGYSRNEVVGRASCDLDLWPTPAEWDDLVTMVKTGQSVRGVECRLRKRSGEIAETTIWCELIELSHEPCILTSITDITERKFAERQLRESEKRFRDFAEAAGEYVWELDIDGRFTYVSRRVEQVLGYAPEALYGRRPMDLMPAGEQERVRDWYTEVVKRRQPFRNMEYRSLARAGGQVWQLVSGVPIFDPEGRLTGYRGTALDITERKQAEARISELATRDPLTGLPNRLLLNDRLAQCITNCQRNGDMLALMFLDLDHFKSINDSLGHDIGDELLKEMARRIGAVLRKGDTLARQGGDEFVIVLDSLKSPSDAGQVAQKIINSLGQPYDIAQSTIQTGCSIGIAMYPSDGDNPSVLMRHADTAMYVAKSSGRKNYQFFSADMNVRATERLNIEGRLRGALARNELRVHFQPRIDVSTGTLTGAEALLRWQHPERGLIPASEFLSVVEESGLIHAIGEWVFETACAQAQSWHTLHDQTFSISINVSAKQFNRSLSGRIRTSLTASGLDPRVIELEITEAVLARNLEESLIVVSDLRKLGVRVVVDDFGTGYSSMSHLRRFSVDGIKIDRTFVSGMMTNHDDRVVVRAMIEMARSLRINTIAEGVETQEQLDLLRTMGCEEYAGHLITMPLTALEFEHQWLRPEGEAQDNILSMKPRR